MLPQRFTPKKLRPKDIWPRLPEDGGDEVEELMLENRNPDSPHFGAFPDSCWFANALRTVLSR